MAKSKSFPLKLNEESYDVLRQVADEERRAVADVIRQALEEYMTRKGHTVKFGVERGGYRRGVKGEE